LCLPTPPNNGTVKFICACFWGFFGRDCSVTVQTQYPQLWTFYRVLFGLFFSCTTLIACLGLFFSRKDLSSTGNISRLSLGILAILNGLALIHYSIDPYGILGTVNIIYASIVDGIRAATALFIFAIILFHWVEIYVETVKRLNQKEMISKIRSDLDRDVTLDEILMNVNVVHRFRLPSAIGIILLFAFRIIGMVMKGVRSPVYLPMQLAFSVLMFVGFGSIAVGYLYFGRKLYKLFPKPLDARMKRVSLSIGMLAIWDTLLFIVIFVIFLNQSKFSTQNITSWFAADFMFTCGICVSAGWVLSVFVRPIFERMYHTFRGSFRSSGGVTDVSI